MVDLFLDGKRNIGVGLKECPQATYCGTINTHNFRVALESSESLLYCSQDKDEKRLRGFKCQSSISPGRLEPGQHGLPGGME